MRIRGERECQECGRRWTYYETGAVECPDCGSLRSAGVGSRARHTDDGDADLDLSAARSAAADDRLREAAREAADAARRYVGRRGFINGGELRDLDDRFLAAHELRCGADVFRRGLSPDDPAEHYFLSLLRGAPDGERPDEVPPSMHAARGLAAAAAVDAYHGDLTVWLRDHDATPAARSLVERLGDNLTRVEALDGDVPPSDADRLVAAARALGAYFRGGEGALERARSRLDALEA